MSKTVEERQKKLARKPKLPRRVPTVVCPPCCDVCWEPRSEAGRCDDCHSRVIAEQSRHAIKSFVAPLSKKAKKEKLSRERDTEIAKEQQKKRQRVKALTGEGFIPLMARLMAKKKTPEQIYATYAEIYQAKGQTNEKWIRARIATYQRIVKENQ